MTAHFNGLYEGVNTHFGISWKILKGEHDDLLKWPLRATIGITILKIDTAAHRELRWFEPTFTKPDNNNPSNEIYSNTDITIDELQNYVYNNNLYVICNVSQF